MVQPTLVRRPGGGLRSGLWTVLLACLWTGSAQAAAPSTTEGPLFVDRAVDWGLQFTHFNGMTGAYYFPEMTGQGCAFVDYDGDGDLDAYLVQGGLLGPEDTLEDALFPPASGDRPPRDRLFRNDPVRLDDGTWESRFVDVTGDAGLEATGYGMGVATGDADGDGRVDLYVANYGPNQLWRNRGDGTFEDVTAEAGVGDERWSIGAAFADLDTDGRLDLYVVNYVDFDVAENPKCFTAGSRRDYCGPSDFPPVGDRLFRNVTAAGPAPAKGDAGAREGAELEPGAARGRPRFADVSGPAGIARSAGPGLGVVADDFDGDGRTDLFVANDGEVNFLWRNRGPGAAEEGEGTEGNAIRLADDALLAGVALNREGAAEASMGVAAGDFDADGDPDLFMTHLMGETNTLYVNDGGGLFEDRTQEAGLGAASFPYTSFGTGWVDVDNDGWLDLFVGSGAVRVLEERARAGDLYPLDQPNQLFRNVPRGARGQARRFEDASAIAGEAFAAEEVTRGAAFGDVDRDGDVDLLIANNNGPARLLVNRAEGAGDAGPGRGDEAASATPPRWIALELLTAAGAPALGARVEIVRVGGPTLHRRVRTDGSYASAHDPRIVAGLGAAADVEEVRVRWPDGQERHLRGLAPGRSWTLYAPNEDHRTIRPSSASAGESGDHRRMKRPSSASAGESGHHRRMKRPSSASAGVGEESPTRHHTTEERRP
ncbi:MAG: CRTAC1 family protein [bacterium]